MYKQRRRRTRNEESAAQSAKWPAAEQELLHSVRPAAPTALPPCNTNSVTTLQPYRPTTLPPLPSPSANQGKKTGRCLHYHASLYNLGSLSLSSIPSD